MEPITGTGKTWKLDNYSLEREFISSGIFWGDQHCKVLGPVLTLDKGILVWEHKSWINRNIWPSAKACVCVWSSTSAFEQELDLYRLPVLAGAGLPVTLHFGRLRSPAALTAWQGWHSCHPRAQAGCWRGWVALCALCRHFWWVHEGRVESCIPAGSPHSARVTQTPLRSAVWNNPPLPPKERQDANICVDPGYNSPSLAKWMIKDKIEKPCSYFFSFKHPENWEALVVISRYTLYLFNPSRAGYTFHTHCPRWQSVAVWIALISSQRAPLFTPRSCRSSERPRSPFPPPQGDLFKSSEYQAQTFQRKVTMM